MVDLQQNLIRLGAVCVAQIDSRFFLLVEIESPLGEQVVIFRISQAQFNALVTGGVPRCAIVEEIPEEVPGLEVELLCVFTVGSQAFLVFDVENRQDRLVLVRTDICPIIDISSTPVA